MKNLQKLRGKLLFDEKVDVFSLIPLFISASVVRQQTQFAFHYVGLSRFLQLLLLFYLICI